MRRRIIFAILIVCLSLVYYNCSLAATVSQTNALSCAQDYLSYTAFSRISLISQLEYEGFSKNDAIYAVDNCGADWNKQAIKMAKTYLNYTAFSEDGLISQLEYEGFTTEQARYGVQNCEADWFEQAVLCGQHYMRSMPFSERSLYDQLIYEGFSTAQARHATNELFYSSSEGNTPELTSTPTPNLNKSDTSDDTNVKTVQVPVGAYIVGEDIPAGYYTLSSEKYATIRLYSKETDEYYDESYSCDKPNYIIGKIKLIGGMKVQILHSPMSFSTYDSSSLLVLMENDEPATVYIGEYIVGVDIPAGSYSLSSTSYATIRIYKSEDDAYYYDSYSCDKPDYTIGKITLKDGMKILILHSDMIFNPYKGLGF